MLQPLQGGLQPLGQFDGYDLEVLNVLGGEVGTLIGVALDSDNAAKDADGSDGYVGVPPAHTRPAVSRTLASGARPLMLIDDGLDNYGTLFGRVVGGTTGQVSTGGALLGPHTATASGKLTLWDKPGTYSVTLDAVDTAADGLVPTNAALSVGDPLYATSAGLLTPESTRSFEASVIVGRFIQFTTDRSLVTTPVQLVSALNSPSGQAAQQLTFTKAEIHFNPPGS